jgi:hypothetical protein
MMGDCQAEALAGLAVVLGCGGLRIRVHSRDRAVDL